MENFDFMQYISELMEQIEESVSMRYKNRSYVLLAKLLFYVSELYESKQIDKELYKHTLHFYGKMHALLLSAES